MPGRAVVISGPSGVGKTAVCDALTARDPRFVRSVSATTRAARPGEEDGRAYHFVGEAEFRRGIEEGRFLEWAEVYGRLYGTPREPVERAVREGRFVLLNIDVQGASKVRESGLDALFIFLVPPGREDLERRLRGRGTDGEAAIARRLAVADREMEERRLYDHCVLNDDLARAADEVRAIVERETAARSAARAAGRGA